MSNVLISGSSIIISTEPYVLDASGDHVIDATKVAARWEIDPDDEKSFQLRIPSESFSGSADRIAFYVSASGEIGVNTKTPQSSFDFVPIGTKKVIQGKTKITGSMNITGDITSSGIISSSGYLYVAGFDGGTF
jgi:hypothetical protein